MAITNVIANKEEKKDKRESVKRLKEFHTADKGIILDCITSWEIPHLIKV